MAQTKMSVEDGSFTSTGIDELVNSEKIFVAMQNCSNIMNGTENGNISDCSDVNQIQDLEVGIDFVKIAVLSIIIVLTFLGNVAIIIAIAAKGSRSKLTRMFYFILHLSIADLLTAFFTLLPEVVWTLTFPDFHGGVVMCKFVKFTQMLGPYLSSYILIMTAVDRYQAICNPLGNCTWTPKRSKIMISLAWSISLLLCIPQAIIFQGDSCKAHFEGQNSEDYPNWGLKTYIIWFSFSNFFIPLVILFYCYTRICYVIWENGKQRRDFSPVKDESTSDNCFKVLTRFAQQKSKAANNSIKKSKIEEDRATQIEDDPNAILAIEKLQNRERRDSDSSSDSSLESADQNLLKLGQQRSDDQELENRNDSKKTVQLEVPVDSNGHNRSSSPKRGYQMPRVHSSRNISRAKIKTVKLTVAVIAGYILCSTPFVLVQIVVTFGNPPKAVYSYITFLFYLLTLNSMVNPFLYLAFNANLVESLTRFFCPGLQGHDERHGGKTLRQQHRKNRGNTDTRMATSRSASPSFFTTQKSVTTTTTVLHSTNRLSGSTNSVGSSKSSKKSSPPHERV